MKKLFLLDGSSLLFRAFYALPLLTGPSGEYTNAVTGFANMLLRIIKEHQPDMMAVAFDKSRQTFRTRLFPEYKGTRGATPEEFKCQVPILEEMMEAWGISFLELDDYEADDILGTLSKQAEESGEIETCVVTGDRDSLQLIGERVKVIYTKRGISDTVTYDEAVFAEEYGGLKPIALIDLKGLMGDSSDNIPGVPGVGQKTALKLLQEHGTVENVLAHIPDIKGKKLQENLRANEEQARLSKELATIVRDVPMAEIFKGFDELTIRPNGEMMEAFCRKYGLNAVGKNFARQYAAEIKAQKEAKAAGSLFDNGADDDMGADLFGQNEYPPCPVPVVYDLKALYHENPAEAEKLEAEDVLDLTLGAYLVNPNEGDYSMERLAARYGVHGDMAELQQKLGGAVYERLTGAEGSSPSKLWEVYTTMERPLTGVLAGMEKAGILIDREALKAGSIAAAERLDRLQSEIYELAGGSFNINSPKQLGEILFEKLGLPAEKKTKTGYSTSVDVLENLAPFHPIIGKILTFRHWAKLKSTYLDGLEPLIGADGRIHTTFNQTVAATGRLSSTAPNLQNIPVRTDDGKEIRRLFRPDKAAGYDLLMSADYSQIELRILAHLSEDEGFLSAFNSGEDIHARTAAEVFGKSIEEVTSEERSRAKAVNFGIVYGISDFGLAKSIGCSRKEAAAYIEQYFSKCPGIKRFLDETVAAAHQNGRVETAFGRQRDLPEIHSNNFNRRSNAERMAMNTPIQGTAADVIKLAMIAADKAIKEKGLKSRLLLQVHDELVLEVPAAEKEVVEAVIRGAMENVVQLKVPLPVDVNFGENWAEAK
ncbi:MAG: DNA polymerase I [Selenomonadaceae bacterium]|nr:DNA polymerase I [Selenomonadaceae bacterium]